MVDLTEALDRQRERVDVDHLDLSIRELVRMVEADELVMAPAYQRQFRWDEHRESELVESILLGLPVPPIFVATNADGTWDLVDGLQRISSILHFSAVPGKFPSHIKKKESLSLSSNLTKLEEFRGLRYADLPRNIQLLFDRRLLRVTALSDKSKRDVRFDLFERLNRGGITLSPQEVRACIYRGPFNVMIEELARELRASGLLKLQRGGQTDGTYEEQILKFFAYLDGREDFRHNVSDFLNEFMAAHQTLLGRSEWPDECRQAMADLQTVFAGRAVLKRAAATTPLNQFEAVFVAAAELRREGITPSGDPAVIMEDEELIRTSTRGTNSPRALEGRIARARSLMGGHAVADDVH